MTETPHLWECVYVCVSVFVWFMCWCQMTDRMNKQIIYINIINGDDKRPDRQTYETHQMPKIVHLHRPMGIKHFPSFSLLFSSSLSLSICVCVIFFCFVAIKLFSGSVFISSDSFRFFFFAQPQTTAVSLWSLETCSIRKQWLFNVK